MEKTYKFINQMNKSLLQKAEQHVKELLSKKLPDHMTYHNLDHTLLVRENALIIGKLKKLSEKELMIVEMAALFHDTGFIKTYEGHEEASKEIAKEFLQENNVDKNVIEKVHSCIEATKMNNYPTDDAAAVLKDGDLATLGQEDFLIYMKKLREEWKVVFKENLDDESWYAKEISFLKGHQYYTQEARMLYGKQKQKNIKKLKKKLKQLNGGSNKSKKSKTTTTSVLATSKSAQMMFKTALRNHIDLTNIADNKANIMLSINALIVTIMIPLLPSRLAQNPFVIYPASILLITCVVAIIYGTLVTRPIKMNGQTNLDNLSEGKSNLFFFGNFYSMKLDTYQSAIEQVLSNEKILDKSIVNDLYFLGEALGNKYSMLRKCYMVFMIGMTLSVVAFALAFWLAA